MKRDQPAQPVDPQDAFEAALRRENDQIQPSDALRQRISTRLDEMGVAANRYQLVIAAGTFRRRVRRCALPLAAVLAVGITAAVFVVQRNPGQSHPRAAGTHLDANDNADQPEAPPAHRREQPTSVVMTGDHPTIVRELPTGRPDVTIVWVYDAARPKQTEEPATEPVGALPATETTTTGTLS